MGGAASIRARAGDRGQHRLRSSGAEFPGLRAGSSQAAAGARSAAAVLGAAAGAVSESDARAYRVVLDSLDRQRGRAEPGRDRGTGGTAPAPSLVPWPRLFRAA